MGCRQHPRQGGFVERKRACLQEGQHLRSACQAVTPLDDVEHFTQVDRAEG